MKRYYLTFGAGPERLAFQCQALIYYAQAMPSEACHRNSVIENDYALAADSLWRYINQKINSFHAMIAEDDMAKIKTMLQARRSNIRCFMCGRIKQEGWSNAIYSWRGKDRRRIARWLHAREKHQSRDAYQ